PLPLRPTRPVRARENAPDRFESAIVPSGHANVTASSTTEGWLVDAGMDASEVRALTSRRMLVTGRCDMPGRRGGCFERVDGQRELGALHTSEDGSAQGRGLVDLHR